MCTLKVFPALARRTARAAATLPRPLEIKTSGQGGARTSSSTARDSGFGHSLGGKYFNGMRGRRTRFSVQRRLSASASPTHWLSMPAKPSVRAQQVRSGIARREGSRKAQSFHQGRPSVALGFPIHKPLLSYPVHLNDLALALKGQVPVEGMIAPPEDQERADCGRNLFGHVVDVRRAIEQPQTPALIGPSRIHVEQHGKDFTRSVRVYLSISAPAAASHGEHGRAAVQAERELLLHGLPELCAVHSADKLRKVDAEFYRRQRKAAALLDMGISVNQPVLPFGPNEIGNDQVIERVSFEARRAESFEIQYRPGDSRFHGFLWLQHRLIPFRVS